MLRFISVLVLLVLGIGLILKGFYGWALIPWLVAWPIILLDLKKRRRF